MMNWDVFEMVFSRRRSGRPELSAGRPEESEMASVGVHEISRRPEEFRATEDGRRGGRCLGRRRPAGWLEPWSPEASSTGVAAAAA